MPLNKKFDQNNSIKYTNRDFNSIQKSLIDYIKRYYGDKDFSQSGFTSLMIDIVSHVGDNLSYSPIQQLNILVFGRLRKNMVVNYIKVIPLRAMSIFILQFKLL
jgi:hypothetical protein